HKVICISESILRLGLEEDMFHQQKAIVLGRGSSNGLDLTFFNPDSYTKKQIETIREQLDIRQKFVYGFVGRIVDRKGISELYNAFLEIKRSSPNIHLLIVGKANLEQVSDPTLMGKLENDKDVTLTGYVDNVNDYLS